MVVIAAAVCTKSGKPLLSRQFVSTTRGRIEGLLAAFPKLMGTSTKEHTFIETDTIRYVYQPMENLYMLLISNKSSNILEDLESLHLLVRIVPEYCMTLDEESVKQSAFELIFAFDEAIAMGYREKVTIDQIKTVMKMDSHEEKVHMMVKENQVKAANVFAKEKAKEIREKRALGGRTGLGSADGWGPSSAEKSFSTYVPEPTRIKTPSPVAERKASSGGMKLSVKTGNKTNDLLRKALEEDGIDVSEAIASTETASTSSPTPAKAAKETKPVQIRMKEQVTVVLDKEEALKTMDVKGMLSLRITDDAYSKIAIKLTGEQTKAFSWSSHPIVDKKNFRKNVLVPKSEKKPFMTGAVMHLVRWRYQSTDESAIPLKVNCWPSAASDETTVVNLEYELLKEDFTLEDVVIKLPFPPGAAPAVEEESVGTIRVDNKERMVVWNIPFIDSSNMDGTAEFTLATVGSNAQLFPVVISFRSSNLFCTVDVGDVSSMEGGEVPFSVKKQMATQTYQIEFE